MPAISPPINKILDDNAQAVLGTHGIEEDLIAYVPALKPTSTADLQPETVSALNKLSCIPLFSLLFLILVPSSAWIILACSCRSRVYAPFSQGFERRQIKIRTNVSSGPPKVA